MRKTVIIAMTFTLALFLTSAIVCLGGINAFAAGSGIAVVNMQKVAAESNQGKAAQSQLKALVQKYNAELMGMRKHIASIQEDLKNNGSIMSAGEKAKKTREFETDISGFQSKEKSVQDIVAKKRYELLKAIVDKATGIINSIASGKGYILVLDKPGVVYNEPSIDITGEVLSQMNGAK